MFRILLSVILLIILVADAGLIITTGHDIYGKQATSEEVKTAAKIAFGILVVALVIQTLKTVIGFIGIFKLNIRVLYVFTGVVLIQTFLELVGDILCEWTEVNISSTGMVYVYLRIFSNFAVLCIMHFLITELRKVNHMT